MKKLIKIFSLFTALCLVAALVGCSGGADTDIKKTPHYEKGTLCSKDKPLTHTEGDLTLSLDPATCNISVTDIKTGTVWSSNPAAEYEDALATGVTKTNIQSQIAVNYVDATNAIKPTNSRVGSVMKKTYDIYKVEGGFRVDYTFSQGFVIPVSYTIEQGKFVATVLYSGISETGDSKLSTIELLPYFGTAHKNEEGFLLVPDGSGAVINFNNGKTKCTVYEKKVYGIDESLPNDYETTRQEQIYVAAIGMKKENAAFVARAVSGEADSYVTAAPSGIASEMNSVSFKAVYRSAENLSVMNGSLGTAGLVMYASEEPTDVNEFRVEYSFINRSGVTVGDMAKLFREEMIKSGSLQKNSDGAFLYTDIYGGVAKPKSFAGIQYTGTEKLTVFEDAVKLTEELNALGVKELTVGYKNYTNSYFKGKAEINLSPVSSLGGKKGLAKLYKYAEEKGIDLYMFADFYSIQKSGNGFSRYSDITKELDLGAASIHPKKLNTNIPNTSADPYYLIRAAAFSTAAEKILSSAEKNGISGIYLGDISGTLAGDYSIGGIKRSGASLEAAKAAEKLSSKKLMLSSPNFYMWKYMDKAVNIPVTSSAEHIFDYDVPLLQMLLKGSVSYAGYEMNLSNTDDDAFLSHIAFGQNIHYGFMSEEAASLQNTGMIDCYGLSFEKAAEAAERAKSISGLYEHIKGLYIEDFSRKGDVTTTVYTDGISVVVNFGEKETTVGENVLAPRSYIVLKDGKTLLKGGDSV